MYLHILIQYRVFTGNCGRKSYGQKYSCLSSYIVIIILFVLPNVGHLRKKYYHTLAAYIATVFTSSGKEFRGFFLSSTKQTDHIYIIISNYANIINLLSTILVQSFGRLHTSSLSSITTKGRSQISESKRRSRAAFTHSSKNL